VTDRVAEVERIHVHPAFQRRGFARLILIRLEDRARELGYRQVGRGQLSGAEVMYFARSLT
jgi:GNAT superfamily N-acetyltransferase